MPLPLVLVGAAALGSAVYAGARDSNKDEVNNQRKKERDQWRRWSRQIANLTPYKNYADSTGFSPSKVRRDSSSSLEIQDQSGETAMYISEIKDPKSRIWENVHESEQNPISRLNPLLSFVPLALIRADLATTKYMVVECSGPLIKAAGENGLFRAIVKEGGQFKENAFLSEPNRLSSIVSLGAFWQIASIALAQKHLHDINQKLNIIGRQIEEISKFQKNERISKVSGCRRYFIQMLDDLKNGIIVPERTKTIIETQCVEVLKVEDHLQLDLQNTLEEMNSIGLEESFTTQVQQQTELLAQLFVCLETRLIGYSLIAIAGEDESFVNNRLRGIRHDISRLKQQVVHYADYIFDKLSEEVSFWGNVGKFEEVLIVLAKLRPRERLEKSFGRVYDGIALTQTILDQRKRPQKILIKVNGNAIDGFSVNESANN